MVASTVLPSYRITLPDGVAPFDAVTTTEKTGGVFWWNPIPGGTVKLVVVVASLTRWSNAEEVLPA